MNKSYDVYMCRERKESEMNIELALEALRKSSVNHRYVGMGECKAWTERHLATECFTGKSPDLEPYFNAQTGKDKQIIRKVSWVQRIFGW